MMNVELSWPIFIIHHSTFDIQSSTITIGREDTLMSPVTTASDLRLAADTAADLMMPNPVSLRDNASLRDALVLLTTKGLSAAPVTDDAGHPIGVLSHSDLLIHQREQVDHGASKQATI